MICVNQSKSRAEVPCFVLTNSRALRCWKRGLISWLQNSSTGKIWVRAPRSYTRRWLCITGIFLQPGVRVSAQVGASHIGGARCWCGQWWQSLILVENQDGGKERRSQWFNAIHFDLKLLRCCDAHVLLTSLVTFIKTNCITVVVPCDWVEIMINDRASSSVNVLTSSSSTKYTGLHK